MSFAKGSRSFGIIEANVLELDLKKSMNTRKVKNRTMKAFLSHSSHDKAFVTQVYEHLGAAQAHLDSVTFEKARLNTDAIHRALSDCEIFVLFLSKDSLESAFVDHESLLALERLGAGLLQRIMLICIDEVSVESVEERLRNLNIVTYASSVGSCKRRIQTALVEANVDSIAIPGIFVGRELENKNIRRSLTRPSIESPAIIVLSGIDGVGRTSLAERVFREVLPPFSQFLPIPVVKNQGIDDFFRSLVRSRGRTTVQQAARELIEFSNADASKQFTLIHEEILHVLNESETLLLIDYGGLMDDEGAYHEYIAKVFHGFRDYHRPCAVFIQRRMPPYAKRRNLNHFHFERVPPLSEAESHELIGARLRSEGLKFTENQVARIADAVLRHPINIEYAIDNILDINGDIDLFLSDTSDLIVWRNRRALDFINRIDFLPIHVEICSLLLLFNYLPTEIITELCTRDSSEVSKAIRFLIERHIVENHNGNYVLAAPIIDAIRRSGLFDLTKQKERMYATELLRFIEGYQDADEIHRALLEPAVIASLRSGGSAQAQWRQLVLPSHYLVLAREAYDNRDFEETIKFCRLSIEHASRMSTEALVECYRMLGLSAVRDSNDDLLKEAGNELSKIKTRYARQVRLFLRGFSHRFKGFFSEAERAYLQCYDENERNFSVCRELAQVYLALGRPDEAEGYARTAFEAAPNNAFILDILVGVILARAKIEKEDLSNDRELAFLLSELEKYGNDEGQSFYANRMAEYHVLLGEANLARKFASDAISRAPWMIPPYITRANVLLMKGNEVGARRDISEANRLSRENQSYGNLYRIELFEIELDVLIAKKRYRAARNLMERIPEKMVPGTLFIKLQKMVASAIVYDQSFHDQEMIDWAKIYA